MDQCPNCRMPIKSSESRMKEGKCPYCNFTVGRSGTRKRDIDLILSSKAFRNFDLQVRKERTRENARLLVRKVFSIQEENPSAKKYQIYNLTDKEKRLWKKKGLVPRRVIIYDEDVRDKITFDEHTGASREFDRLINRLAEAGLLHPQTEHIIRRRSKKNKVPKNTFYALGSRPSGTEEQGWSPQPWELTTREILSRCRTALAKEDLLRLGIKNPSDAILDRMNEWRVKRGFRTWYEILADADLFEWNLKDFRREEERFAFWILFKTIVKDKELSDWGDYFFDGSAWITHFNGLDMRNPKLPKAWNIALDHIQKRLEQIFGPRYLKELVRK